MKEESLLLLSDLQKLINQVVLIDYTIIILGERQMAKKHKKKEKLSRKEIAELIIEAVLALAALIEALK